MRLIIILLFLNGCAVSIGLTYIPHDTEIEQPLGVLRLSRDFTENISGECEHLSSAFTAHDVVTLDHCGIFYNF